MLDPRSWIQGEVAVYVIASPVCVNAAQRYRDQVHPRPRRRSATFAKAAMACQGSQRSEVRSQTFASHIEAGVVPALQDRDAGKNFIELGHLFLVAFFRDPVGHRQEFVAGLGHHETDRCRAELFVVPVP